jgi:translocator protein
MKKHLFFAILNVLSLAVTLSVSITTNIDEINVISTGDITNKFDILFKPSAYVFSIWSIIYMGLIVFAVFQILPAQLKSGFHGKIGIYFIVCNIANALWMYNWHYENFLLTVLLIIVMLYCLAKIYSHLEIGLTNVSLMEKLSAHFPFSFYTAWICIGTVVNIFVYIESRQWTGFGIPEYVWFSIALLASIALLFYIIYKRTDMAFGFVFLWSFVGIADQNAGHITASRISWIGVGIIICILIYGILKKFRAPFF